MPYNYILGKGQFNKKNMFKSVQLDTGIYNLFIQVEIPDTKENKGKFIDIDFTISFFSESLIDMRRLQEPENFLRNVYESCILEAEKKFGGTK